METQPVGKAGGRRCSIWGSFEAARHGLRAERRGWSSRGLAVLDEGFAQGLYGANKVMATIQQS